MVDDGWRENPCLFFGMTVRPGHDICQGARYPQAYRFSCARSSFQSGGTVLIATALFSHPIQHALVTSWIGRRETTSLLSALAAGCLLRSGLRQRRGDPPDGPPIGRSCRVVVGIGFHRSGRLDDRMLFHIQRGSKGPVPKTPDVAVLGVGTC